MSLFQNSTKLLVGGALIGALALAGCGSSSKSSSSTNTTGAGNATTTTVSSSTGSTSPSDTTVPVCGSLNQFTTSIQDLIKPSTLTGGKDSINNAIDSAKQDVENLKSSLKADDKPKVDAFNNAIDDLKTAVGKGVSGLGDAASAAQDVGTTGQALITALKAGCPSS